GAVKGFGLRIEPSGAKVFFLTYRFPKGRAGKQRRMKLGDFGTLTVDQARTIARKAKSDVDFGVDPMAVREEQRRAVQAERAAPKHTVARVCEDFVKRHCQKHNRSWREAERL